MAGVKSVAAGGTDWAKDVAAKWYTHFANRFPLKFYWFATQGYVPHEWQAAFHSATDDRDLLCRYRHLVAGRRGGKTLSAAWDVLYYCLHPEEFHRDIHGVESSRPLWVWILAENHEIGFPAKIAFLDALNQSGLVKGKDYEYNKTEKKIEFANGTLVQFKTAEDPQMLRGAGLDILWIDEAAMIRSDEAYNVVRPALADKRGIFITTTTPKGKNWFHERFWSEQALANPRHFRVEYTSIDNPYFSAEEWEEERESQHPVMFKQEYMASFDSMTGIALHGDWLRYFVFGKPDPFSDDVSLPRDENGDIRLHKYLGIDPAISLSDRADYFAMCLIGVPEDRSRAYILKTFKGRLTFPDQIDEIKRWALEHRPDYIGIEANAYQAALAQMTARLEGLPPITAIISRGKKVERIMSMAPLFKVGKVRIHSSMGDFVEEWVGYDPEIKNPKDDLLDATEIALGTANVLLPSTLVGDEKPKPKSMDEEAWEQVQARQKKRQGEWDESDFWEA